MRLAAEAICHSWVGCDLRVAAGSGRHNGFGSAARHERLAGPGRVPGLLGLLVWALSAVLPVDGVYEEGLRSAGSDRPGHQRRS